MSAGNVCDNCNFRYELTPDNTIIHFFECQPWFSFGQSLCPACGNRSTDPETGQTIFHPAKLFFRDEYDTYMEFFIMQDFGFVTEDFAPTETVRSFEGVYKVHELDEVYVNKRLELEIRNFHTVLENIPDDLLLNMLGAD